MVSGSQMRIAFFGDSLVNGTGDQEMLGWPGRACAKAVARGHQVTCYNLGIRRDRSVDVAARWLDEARRRLPAGHDGRVIFSFGTNDAMQLPGDAPAAETLAALTSILSHRHEWPMAFVGPAPIDDALVNQRIVRIDAAMAGLCAQAGVGFLSVFAPLVSDASWMAWLAAGDGAHPGAQGYHRLSTYVEAWPLWRQWLP